METLMFAYGFKYKAVLAYLGASLHGIEWDKSAVTNSFCQNI